MATIQPQSTSFDMQHTFSQLCTYMKTIEVALQRLAQNKSNECKNDTDASSNYGDIPSDVATNYVKSFPAFCNGLAARKCVLTPLYECEECSNAIGYVFGFVVAVLGLLIIAANVMVIWLFMKKKSVFTGSYIKIKMSLAVADLLTGIMCFVTILPNLVMTMQSTSHQVLLRSVCLVGSPRAIGGGILHVLTLTASLFHLVFLGQQRFYAIRWAVMYKRQPRARVYFGIAVVWTLAILFAVSPLWFPKKMSFGYQYMAFFFIPVATHLHYTGPDYSVLIVIFSLAIVLPFILMTGTSIASGICFVQRIKKTSHILSGSSARRKEMTAFVTMAAMQIGFTATFVPLIFYISLNFNFNFSNSASPWNAFISFTLSLSNSLVNVLVYSVVDVKFRQSAMRIAFSCPCEFRRVNQ